MATSLMSTNTAPITTSHVAELPRETEGLPEAARPSSIELADGDEFELEIAPVKKRIGDATVRMLAYNGSVPGPTLKVPQGATITVHVTNHGDLEATVHWHGLRLENRYDGTHETQAPIPVGESFTYQVHVPDPGAYWYHPHIREDYGQELGLYGNILVTPSDADYWPPANRELLAHARRHPDRGRADRRLQRVGDDARGDGPVRQRDARRGRADLSLEAKRGEVVRFYFTNTANTRVFNVALPGAQMKLVGADAATTSARSSSRRCCSLRPSVSSSTCSFPRPGELDARAPNARAHLPACDDQRLRRPAGAVVR